MNRYLVYGVATLGIIALGYGILNKLEYNPLKRNKAWIALKTTREVNKKIRGLGSNLDSILEGKTPEDKVKELGKIIEEVKGEWGKVRSSQEDLINQTPSETIKDIKELKRLRKLRD